jgi:hypothetical protein
MIRLDGAADLCSSLIVNTTLTYLDLSFNSLGSIGGKYMQHLWMKGGACLCDNSGII